MKKLHRGPTIVLTLVPAFTAGIVAGLVIYAGEKAKQYQVTEDDKKYLAEINALMVYGKEYSAPHKVIMSLKNNGYDVLTHKFSNANFELAFDASVKQFILMYGDRILATPDGYTMTNSQVVFKFTNSYDKDSKYGQYLLDDYVWDNPNEKFEIKASIDVGNNTNIKYMEYVPDNSNASATRLMRTYCEYLVFPANNDTIFHMGESNNIEVYGTSKTSKCNYMELGKTSYMYVENVALQVAKINSADQAQIDVLEVSTVEDTEVVVGTTAEGKSLFHTELITMLIGKQIIGAEEKAVVEITEVDDFDDLKQAFTDSKYFIRLTAPITITEPFEITDRKCIIDLNRNTITDSYTAVKNSALIQIKATSSDSSLTLIDSWRQGEIILNDHFITVEGNTDGTSKKTATLYLEGANISYSAPYDPEKPTANRSGAIMVGNYSSDSTAWQRTSQGGQYSRVYMYGGAINANTGSEEHTVEVAGIYAYNDALIQIYYGAIYSTVNCVRTNGIYSGSTINISDGTFTVRKKNDQGEYEYTVGECIYLPQGKLNISGGTFTAHTCIGIRGGDINISGGYFHSKGAHADLDQQAEGSGLNGDGSVICAQLCNQAGYNAYSNSLKILISNATLQSDNSYVLQVFRNKPKESLSEDEKKINQYLDVTFIDGVYYYATDATGYTYNGIRVSGEVASNFYTIHQNGGSWIKVE